MMKKSSCKSLCRQLLGLATAGVIVAFFAFGCWPNGARAEPGPSVALDPSPGMKTPRPNIILIVVDDMGFSDIGCYGSEISTPNLDALAATGLRFTQFYNAARCCPSRASVLTGLYPHQAGMGHMDWDREAPGYRGRLNDDCVTIAEVLRSAGYFTAMSGKWHVGQPQGVTPWKRGFDRSLNSNDGSAAFYYSNAPGAILYLNGKVLSKDDPAFPKNAYTTDFFTDYGIKFIDEARAGNQPFFLYLAYNAPHFPLQAPTEDIAKYRGKYKAGWDVLREQRYAKLIDLGMVDKEWRLSPKPDDVKDWDRLTPGEQDRFDHIMSVYAACVDHMDHAVGELVAGLRSRNALDNTLIMFLSDNGGNSERGVDGILEGPGEPGTVNSRVFCGGAWATLQNTPFRRYKHFVHEGGIATPLIVHWPAHIAGKGELRTQPGHLVDIMATCVDVAGASYPLEFNGEAILPMEGTSLVPAFENKSIERDAIYWEHEGRAAMRAGDWKLVRNAPRDPWELYDLKTDRTELHDLAAQEQAAVRVEEMKSKWKEWAVRAQVVPYPTFFKKKR